ncbi:MAG TPA: hypothetical protein PKD61_20955 [Polyangiaceae bacterium]|nr:hypothetical protein [Polyangiaceae bacterium]
MWSKILCALTVATLQVGCTEKPEGAKGANSANTPPAESPAGASAPPPAAASTAPVVAAEQASELTHLAATKPGPFDAKCRDLAKTHTPPAQQLAHVLRRLTCEPALYFKPIAEVRKELALQDGYTLTFSGPATAMLEFPAGVSPQDLGRVMDVSRPVAGMASRGAWRHRIWFLGSDEKTGTLDIWGPGKAMIGVRIDYSSLPKDAVVTPIVAGNELRKDAIITMPPEVVPVKHDEVAVKLLLAGLAKLSANRSFLSAEPDAIAKQLGLDGERFRLSKRSIGSTRSGTDIWTARTRIDADPLIKALGLSGKISHRRARDSDDYLLYDSGGNDSDHKYQGLNLELSFDKREGDRYELNGITVN